MAEEKTRFPNNTVVICVDKTTALDVSARLYHCYTEDPIILYRPLEMLKVMEEFFNELGYPQAATRDRKMISKRKNSEISEPAEKEMKMVTTEDCIRKNTGERASFVIKVNSRQNATWQGSILWTERGVTQQFRSALELIKLMDDALNGTNNGNTDGKEGDEL